MLRPALACLFALAASACLEDDPVVRSGPVVSTGQAQLGGDWELIDQTGATRRDEDFLGKPQLIYFGFAYCPDVCPASLTRMGAIADRLDPDGKDFHYLFFTIDPERDTPEALAPYVASDPFPPGLVGLTGSREAVEAAQDAFKIYAQKREDAGASDYLYDHSDYIIVMDENGEYAGLIRPDESPAEAAARIRTLIG